MRISFNRKFCPSSLSKMANSRQEFSLFVAVRAALQLIVRIRRSASMQLTALTAICSILTPGLGPSLAQADMKINSNVKQIAMHRSGSTFDGFWKLEYHNSKILLSSDGKALDVVTNLFWWKSGDAFEVSKGPQLPTSYGLTRYGLIIDRSSDAVLRNGSFGWRRTLGGLDSVKIGRFVHGNVFTVADASAEKDTILVKVGLGHSIEGIFLDRVHYSGLGYLVQNQSFKIEALFNF